MQKVLTVQEAANIARCSSASIRAAIARGALRAKDIGTGAQRRHWRILEEDLRTWLGDLPSKETSNAEVETGDGRRSLVPGLPHRSQPTASRS